MRKIKNLIALTLVASLVVVALALSSCNVTNMVSNNIEAMMDDIMTGDNYTVEYKSESDVYTTMKIGDGQMYISEKYESSLDEYYLYFDERDGNYYKAHEWKKGDKDKGIEKTVLQKDEYLALYVELFTQNAKTSQLFDHRHILEMAEEVGSDNYEYSKEEYSENKFSRTEYTIKITNGELVFLSQHTENIESEEKDDDSQTVRILMVKTTYSDIGDTEIKIPNSILNTK